MKPRRKNNTKKVSKAWLHQHINDPYVQRAQAEGYRSRAAYKLQEINEHFKLVAPGAWVVDLGSAPGAWSQYTQRVLTAQNRMVGRIIALDMLSMEPVVHVDFLQGDFRQTSTLEQLNILLGARKPDVILSDMAPNLSGIASADSARIADLVELAVGFAQSHLSPDGALVLKVFHGSGYSQWMQLCKRTFHHVKAYKPKASRASSSETFLIAIGLKTPTV